MLSSAPYFNMETFRFKISFRLPHLLMLLIYVHWTKAWPQQREVGLIQTTSSSIIPIDTGRDYKPTTNSNPWTTTDNYTRTYSRPDVNDDNSEENTSSSSMYVIIILTVLVVSALIMLAGYLCQKGEAYRQS